MITEIPEQKCCGVEQRVIEAAVHVTAWEKISVMNEKIRKKKKCVMTKEGSVGGPWDGLVGGQRGVRVGEYRRYQVIIKLVSLCKRLNLGYA